MEQAIPRPTGGRLWLGSIVGVALGLVIALLLFYWGNAGERYGSATFCVIPFLAGFAATVFVGIRTPVTYGQAAKLALMCTTVAAAGLLVWAFEGIMCIVMALPIVVPFCMAGTLWGAFVTNWAHRKFVAGAIGAAAPIVPLLVLHLMADMPRGEVRTETTSVVIHASAEKIWPLIFNLGGLPSQKWFLFSLGVACPNGTRASDIRVGGSRTCELSTGDMPEKIAALEPGRYMRFDILRTPPTMKELNPFWDIHPPHLDGYFNCHFGDFRLTPLPDGSTLMTGSSTYDLEMYPAPYWRLWTDTIVEQVHLRMMSEMKRQAEASR